MRKQGFANYDHEWWHFSYAGSAGAPAYDFSIRSPERRDPVSRKP
jgi:D-alanyl-D-alanine dipeptidase